MNFNVLCDSCSESHFRGPVERDDGGLRRDRGRRRARRTSGNSQSQSYEYSLSVLIISLSKFIFTIYIQQINQSEEIDKKKINYHRNVVWAIRIVTYNSYFYSLIFL